MDGTARIMWVCGSSDVRRWELPGASSVTVFGSAREALECRSEWNAQVCVVGARLPDANGTDFIRQVARAADAPRFILIGDHDDGRSVHEAVLAGADGFIVPPLEDDLLRTTVRNVAQGNMTLPTKALNNWVLHLRSAHAPMMHGGLSEREQRVLQLLADGLTYRRIGERLFISPFTVKNHVHSIIKKLGVRSRIEAMRCFLASNK